MRGRKPKPTHLHVVEGTLHATRHRGRRAEPKPQGDLFEAPEWLTDGQKAGWSYAIAHAPHGLLKRLDRSLLAIWVVAEDMHRRAAMQQALLDAGSALPLLTKSAAGPVQSPYLPIINRQAQIMLKAASELGFTPASRSRIQTGEAPDGEKEDPADKYFRRRPRE